MAFSYISPKCDFLNLWKWATDCRKGYDNLWKAKIIYEIIND